MFILPRLLSFVLHNFKPSMEQRFDKSIDLNLEALNIIIWSRDKVELIGEKKQKRITGFEREFSNHEH